MERLEEAFIVISQLKSQSAVRSFVLFVQKHINITVKMAPYIYRALFVPIASYISARYGTLGVIIPMLNNSSIDERINIIQHNNITNLITKLINDSVDEMVKELPEIWDMPKNFDKVKNDIEKIAHSIFKQIRIANVKTGTYEAMLSLSMSAHYEDSLLNLFKQSGDVILDIEKSVGYLTMYQRLVAENMLAYAIAPAFAKDMNVLPKTVLSTILPLIKDVIETEDVKQIYNTGDNIVKQTYNISKDLLE